MRVLILAAESLGVRSMATIVETASARVLVDPGVALARKRGGARPGNDELEASRLVQRRLRNELNNVTDVVITHFHGDHHPMVQADDTQLAATNVLVALQEATVWAIGKEPISRNQSRRRYLLQQALGRRLPPAEGLETDRLAFSTPVPHGEPANRSGTVMMCCIREGTDTFVHASDIQFLDDEPLDTLIDWSPTLVFASGPPVYLMEQNKAALEAAEHRVRRLADTGATVVLDHHLMRSDSGLKWLDRIGQTCPNVCCAADFLNQPRNLLEAHRTSTRH